MVDAGVRLRAAARLLVDRVEHHAAEEEPRHRRAGPRQGGPADRRPDRAAGHAQGACRWPTTATCRRTRSRCSTPSTPSRSCCPPSRAWSRTLEFDTRPDGRAGAAGLLAGDRRRRVAGPRRECRSGGARGRRRLRTALRGARRGPARAHRRAARRHLAAPDARACATCSPWTGSVASRTGRGGTAPVRVREQLAELRRGRAHRTGSADLAVVRTGAGGGAPVCDPRGRAAVRRGPMRRGGAAHLRRHGVVGPRRFACLPSLRAPGRRPPLDARRVTRVIARRLSR